METHGRGASHVIVASSCSSEPVWGIRDEFGANFPRENTQPFQCTGYVGPCQAVVAMPSLHLHFDQVFGMESIQVHACRRWSYLSHDRKFCAGSGETVHQAKQHAGSRRFTNGSRNSGDSRIRRVARIHTFTLDEVSLMGKRHSERYAGNTRFRENEPPPGDRRYRGDRLGAGC
jgi:hypothetical protein